MSDRIWHKCGQFIKRFHTSKKLTDDGGRFESIENPVHTYERSLFSFTLLTTVLAKIISSWEHWNGLYIVALVLMIITCIILIFHLLVPPRLSAVRIGYILSLLLFYYVFIYLSLLR